MRGIAFVLWPSRTTLARFRINDIHINALSLQKYFVTEILELIVNEIVLWAYVLTMEHAPGSLTSVINASVFIVIIVIIFVVVVGYYFIAEDLHFCLLGFLTSSSTTRLYHGRVPRLTSDNFTCCQNTRQSGETMTSVSVGHIILTPI